MSLSLEYSFADDFTVTDLGDYGNVTVMEVTGNYDANKPDGTLNAEPRQAIAKEFFKTHIDEYDFLVIFTNFDFQFPEADAKAFYMGVKNDVQGLGIDLFDHSSLFGSNGRLQGIIDIGNISTLAADPRDPDFEETLSTLAHEQLHRWGAHLRFRDVNGDVSTDLLGKDNAHWNFLLNSYGSVLYGNYWQDNDDGTFTSIAANTYYSPLDLYLMGFDDKTQVSPMLLINNPEADPERLPEIDVTIFGSPRTVTIEDIIAVEGERFPGVNASQKTFRTAFVFIAEPGTFAGDELYAIENIRNGWVTRYSVLTDGRGIMQVAPGLKDDLPLNPGVFPPPADPRTQPPDIADGVSWLMNNQEADGSWTDSSLTANRDTAAVATTLIHFPFTEEQSSCAAQWLHNNDSESVDYLSRTIVALSLSGQDVSGPVATLLSGQNADGGWGSSKSYTSNPVDTSLALKSFSQIRYSEQSVLFRAIEYLKARQNTNGGWGGDDGVSSVETTANILSAFNQYRSTFQLESQITNAIAWMTQRQNSDGGFSHSGIYGDAASTLYDTASAVLALRRFNISPDITGNGLEYLLGQQSENGSWNSSAYDTALAIDTIWQATIDPDLSVSADDITFIPSSVNSLPSNVVIDATLRNLGMTDIPQTKVMLYKGPVSEGRKIDEQFVALPGLSTVHVTFSIFVRDGNEHRFSLSLDPDNLVDETNESNNTAIKILFPKTTYDFEILPLDISVSPNPADILQEVKVTSRISNSGTMNAYNVRVRYSVEDTQGSFDIGTSTVDIPAGETITDEVTWRADRSGKNLPLTVTVDPLNVYEELSEENNHAVSSVTINGSTAPNLTVSYDDISISDDPAQQGGDTNISALIRNEGFSAASDIQVNFYVGTPGADGLLIRSQVISSMNAGESVSVSADWTGIVESGERIIYITVDPDNRVQEIREDDNDAFTTLKILSLPDLAVSTDSIEFSPPAPKEGDAVSISVTVRNRGEQDASNVSVNAYEGSALIGTQIIPALAGNSQVSASFTYDTTGKSGPHKITVVVDPDHTIAEQAEENNQASGTFGVQDANLWLTEQYISPDGDGVKDNTDFFFRLPGSRSVKIVIVNETGKTVRTFSGIAFENTTSGNITWDGLNDEGMVVDDGQYQIELIDLSNSILGSLLVVVDNNRSPLTEAIGTKYLLNSNLTCMLPDVDSWQWLPDEGGIFFNIRSLSQSAPEYQQGLYTLAPDGQDIFRVLPSDKNAFNYAISPAGKRFVFTTGTQLWISNIDGSNPQLLDEVSVSYSIVDAKWSPDGRYILYNLGQVYISGYGAYELWIIDTESLEKIKLDWGYLTIELTAEWSPDSRKVAYFVIPPDGSCIDELKVSDVSGEKNIIATFDQCDLHTPIYWLDNRTIVPLHPSLGSDLWLYDVGGSGENAEVTGASDFEGEFSRSPDNKSIAFVTSEGNQRQLNIADADGNVSVLRELKPASSSCFPDIYNIIWSPDSRKIAFIETMSTYGGSYYPCTETFGPLIVVHDLQTNTEDIMPSESLTLVRLMSDNQSIIGYRYDKNYHREICAVNIGKKSIMSIASDLYLPYPEENLLSPLERYITFYKKTELAGVCYGRGSQDLWAVSSAMNLTAEFTAGKEKSAVVLKGTAADLHFDGYTLEYADTNHPDTWNILIPPSDMPVINDIFTAWVPPYEGSFYVRLTVRDKAGNVAVQRKRIAWGISSSIMNLYKSNEIFSPNNDGVGDTVELHYTVLEPVHLAFTICDANNTVIRTINRDYTSPVDDSITWDGRDAIGNIVPDGKYSLKVFDYEFFVEVDNTPPDTGIHLAELMQDYDLGTKVGTGRIYTELSGHAVDLNLKNWVIEYGEGENPSDWYAYISGEDQLASLDENGDPIFDPVRDEIIADYGASGIESLVGKKIRITAEDSAGNRSSRVTGFLEEKIILWDDFWQLNSSESENGYTIFVLARPDELYPDLAMPASHHLGVLETIRLPLVNMNVQYYNDRQWFDTDPPVSPVSGPIDLVWDNSSGPREIYAIRIRATDIIGQEHYSNAVLATSLFSVNACNLTAFNTLFEELTLLKFQLRSDQDSRYVQWTDFLVFDAASGQSIPVGSFSINGSLPDLTEGLQYKIRMTGTEESGKYYESIADYPDPGCEGQEPPPVPFRLELTVDYSVADCGLKADGIATLKAYLGGYQDNIILKTLSYYLKKPEGYQLVQSFGLSGAALSDAVVDTNSLCEGSYAVKAVLSYLDTRKNETGELTAVNTLVVDRVNPTARIVYPAGSSHICPLIISDPNDDWQGISIEGEAKDNNRVRRYEMYYGTGETPAEWLPAMTRKYDAVKNKMVDSPILVDGPKQGTLGIWNANGLQEGNVSLKLKVVDAAGNVSCSSTAFSFDNVVEISDLMGDKTLFSPNGDGILDNVAIHYRIDEYSSVDVKVFQLEKDADGFSIPDMVPVRTIASGLQHAGGAASAVWDGRDDSGITVPDGSYALTVSAEDACGNAIMRWIGIDVDNSSPAVVINYPGAADILGNIIEVKGTADDLHFKDYALEAGKGTDPAEWVSIASNTNPVKEGILGTWNASGLEGIWTIRLTSLDALGNLGTVLVTLDLGQRKNLIRDLLVNPGLFSPNSDGRIDTAEINYTLTASCGVMFVIADRSGVVRKTYATDVQSAGAYSLVWDGSDDSGAKVPDGSYAINLSVSLSSNPSVTQDETVTVVVDSILPIVDIRHPLNNSYLTGDIVLTGSITDPSLLEYSINISGDSGIVLTARGNQNREDYTFGLLNALPEGTYLLNIQAKDLGENVTERHTTFTIDRTPPNVVLELPVEGDLYGSGRGFIAIVGSIIEQNLDLFSLQYGRGDNPSQWTTLLNGTIIPVDPQLLTWDVGKNSGIADGLYTLSLTARDKAGMTGETKVRITIDNTPPEVAITVPPADGYVRTPVDITGTASDINLERYTIELSEGRCASAFRWGVLNSSTHPVNAGVIASWQMLPSDGEYCLRLSAEDKIGNSSEIKSDLKVDTHPPSAPLLSGTIENGSTPNLSWKGNIESDIAGYNLYRDGQQINTALVRTTGYSDQSLKEGVYIYAVTAVDMAGNESVFSDAVKLRIDVTGPDAKISSPLNGGSISGIIEIKGTAYSSDDFRQYRVSVAQGRDPAVWDIIRTSPVPVSYGILTQWDTLGLQGDYSLKLEAEDITGNIATHLINVTIDDTPPARPVLISAIPDSSDVELAWQANKEADLAGYLLYKNNHPANAGMATGSLRPYLISGTNYSDKALPDGTYRYSLAAMDQAGNMSAQSNAIEVSLDTHPPHATIVEPANAASFDSTLRIRAESCDTDIDRVQFQYKRAQDVVWINLENPVTQAPYMTTLDPLSLGLTYGAYNLRAVTTDGGGKTDPEPACITITYTDITAPSAPYGLTALTNGKDVTLTWTANAETDLDGYNIYRASGTSKIKINSSFLKETIYHDSNLSDGVYTYELTAVDTLGNESKPSDSVSTKVYIPVIEQSYTPMSEEIIPIHGSSAEAGASVEIHISSPEGTELRTVSADAAGNFSGNITLTNGENSITVQARDSVGNMSRSSDRVVVVYGEPPSAPTGLVVSPQDFSVHLTWYQNGEPNLAGYNIFRNDEKINIPTAVTSGTATASSSDYGSIPIDAFDGDESTSWMSRYNYGIFLPEWWEIDLSTAELISHIGIQWESDSYAGKDYEIQVWSGYAWITHNRVSGNTKAENGIDFTPPYRTDRIRIYITESANADSYKQVGIAEIKILKDNLIAQPSYQDVDLDDGNYRYKVTAVDYYGFESPPSDDAPVAVGDVTPPDAPMGLTATSLGSNATLAWVSNTEPDLAGYNVFRISGQGWIKLNSSVIQNPSFTDQSLLNGAYAYRVTAVDFSGNESLPSNEAPVQVSIALPERPFAIYIEPLPEGKALGISWDYTGSAPSGYDLYRSPATGGPYEKINNTLLKTNAYTDTGLTNGIPYYYVLTSVDSMGNESRYSDEEMGIPADISAPETPRIFFPTIPAVPVITYQEMTDISGIAEPASIVELFRDGNSVGATVSLGRDVFNSFPLTSGIYTAALSPDGRTLAYVYSSSLWLKDLDTEDTTMISQKGTSPRWSPDGQKLAYVFYDTKNYSRISIFDIKAGTDETLTEDTDISEYGPSWSSDGTKVAFRSDKGGSWDAWIKDMKTGLLKQVTDGLSVSDAKLSPDGKKLAHFQSRALSVLDLTDNTTEQVDAASDGYSLDWSPDSSRIAFISRRTGSPNVFVFDIKTHDQFQVTDSMEYTFGPVWSPGGNSLAVGRSGSNGYSVWIMDPSSKESGKVLELKLSYISYLSWIRSGAIAFLEPGLLHAAYMAGYFNVEGMPLEPGENVFSAVSADSSGNMSSPSDGASVIYDTSMMPDLEISEDDILVNPACPKPGEATTIHMVVKNKGTVEVRDVRADIYLSDASGNADLLASHRIPVLDADSEEILWLSRSSETDPGRYAIIAVLDPEDTIPELLETNNLVMKDFYITGEERIQMTTTLDADTYHSDSHVGIRIRLINSGMEKDAVVFTAIEDEKGNVVSTLNPVNLHIPYASQHDLNLVWDTGVTCAGLYRVHTQLRDTTGLLEEKNVSFMIQPDMPIDSHIVTDRKDYGMNEDIRIITTVRNGGENYIVPELQVKIRIADSSGVVIFNDEKRVANLMPGIPVSLQAAWNTDIYPPGEYRAVTEVYYDGDPISNASVVFRIRSSSIITGNITITPSDVASGDTAVVHYAVQHAGNGSVNGLCTKLLIVDPETLEIVSAHEENMDIEQNRTAEREFVFSTDGYAVKPYQVLLQYQYQENTGTIATAFFTVRDGRPLVDSSISTDKTKYTVQEVVHIISHIRNMSAGSVYNDLTAQVSIVNSEDQIVFAEEKPIQSLDAGQVDEVNNSWDTSLYPKGLYTVRLKIVRATRIAGEATTAFEILGSSATLDGLSGMISAGTDSIFQGKDETLAYCITNNGNEDIPTLSVHVLIVKPDTREEVSKNITQMPVHKGETVTGVSAISTMEFQPGTYSAELRAATDLMPGPKILGDTTFEVTPAIDVIKTISATNLLVWVNDGCDKDQGMHAKCFGHGAICVRDDLLREILSEAANTYHLVYDKKDFQIEQRNPMYTDTIILGDSQPIERRSSDEMREQVFSGKGILSSLYLPSRDWGNAYDNSLFGVRWRGDLPGDEHRVQFVVSPLSGYDTLYIRGKAVKIAADNRLTVAGWIMTDKGCREKSQQEQYPALVLNEYGTGKAIYAAFDLGATIDEGNYNRLSAIIKNSLAYIHTPEEPDVLFPNQLIPVRIDLKSTGGYFDVRLTETYPPDIKIYDPSGSRWITDNPWVVQTDIGPDETKSIFYYALIPNEPGSYILETEVGYINRDSYFPYQKLATSLVLSRDETMMINDIISSLKGLSFGSYFEEAKIREAIRYVDNIRERRTGKPMNTEKNISDILHAVDSLSFVDNVDVSEIRLLIDRLLRSLQSRYYLHKFMSFSDK